MKFTKLFLAWVVLLWLPVLSTSAFAYETSYYRDSQIGLFKVSISGRELKNNPVKSIVPVCDGGTLAEVYTFDSRSEKRENVYVDPAEKEASKKREAKIRLLESQCSEMDKAIYELTDENNFMRKYLDKTKKGDFNAGKDDLKTCENKIEDNQKKIKEIEEKLGPIRKELSSLYNEGYYSRRNINISKDELNSEVKFYVLGRYFKSGPAALSLVNAESGEVFLKIELNLSERENKSDADILKQWLDVQKNYFMKIRSGSAGSVFSYIAAQSAMRFAGATEEALIDVGSSFKGLLGDGRPDLYSMASGILAIQESLQLDRMTGPAGRDGQKNYDNDIDILKGPDVKSHPFDLMLEGKTPKTYPIDALVPSDFYYLHFSNIRDQIELSELMDRWGTNFFHLMEVSSTDSMTKEKYLGQLCLKVSELTKLFGDKVIDDMAICGSDPFIEEGTDLSVIFSVKNKTVFDLNVSRYFLEAKAADKEIKDETVDISRFKVRAFYSPDGKVSSYSCYVNDFMVYSNSREAVAKIIGAFENPRKSMAKADDYLYMRTIYETGAANESAFLYLSDAHIRKLVGPEWKIGRQRRINCETSLRMVNNAVTLYYMDKNTQPPTIESLLKGNYIHENYMYCPDGGTYSLAGGACEARCSKHRGLRFMTPISEITPKRVCDEEARQYRNFVKNYNEYWSKFFDPVGIRINNAEKKITLETCILPLVENTIYNQLKDTAGGAPVKFYDSGVPGTIFSIRAKINTKNENNIGMFRHWLSATSFTVDRFMKFIGDNVSVNLLDSDIRFTLDPLAGRLLMMAGRDQFAIFGSFILAALNHPLFVALDVTDMKEAETFLVELIKFIEEENARRYSGFFQTDFSFYKVRPAQDGPPIYCLNYKLFMIGLNFYVMVHDNKLIIATRRSILEDVLKNSADKGEASDANFEFEVNSANFKEISKTYNIIWAEKFRDACHSNLWPIYVLNKFRSAGLDSIKSLSLAVNGYFPYCPAGGEYFYDNTRDMISCRLHGDVYNPTQPMELDEKSELVKFFKSLKKIKASLKFTVHGIMTKVVIERE
ncbi:MAG: hypothetical protein BWY32_03353 [bacterium ADurb.Bin243]|nr:MAG: hypothetical protein BWY32_03353 [bacterium ADurb.Bin243]